MGGKVPPPLCVKRCEWKRRSRSARKCCRCFEWKSPPSPHPTQKIRSAGKWCVTILARSESNRWHRSILRRSFKSMATQGERQAALGRLRGYSIVLIVWLCVCRVIYCLLGEGKAFPAMASELFAACYTTFFLVRLSSTVRVHPPRVWRRYNHSNRCFSRCTPRSSHSFSALHWTLARRDLLHITHLPHIASHSGGPTSFSKHMLWVDSSKKGPTPPRSSHFWMREAGVCL